MKMGQGRVQVDHYLHVLCYLSVGHEEPDRLPDGAGAEQQGLLGLRLRCHSMQGLRVVSINQGQFFIPVPVNLSLVVFEA